MRNKNSKNPSLDKRGMVFKDVSTAMDFLYDLGEKLPSMFEFSPPQNPNEYIRATDGGQTIILHRNKNLSINREVLPVFICQDFCNLIGKYSVWDIVDDSLRDKI